MIHRKHSITEAAGKMARVKKERCVLNKENYRMKHYRFLLAGGKQGSSRPRRIQITNLGGIR
ncbi:MAG: hypothetical protein WBW16_02885 [Bacteroidota bacterium]